MKCILDSRALLAFYKNELNADNIQKILDKIDKRKIEGFISPVTVSEVYYIIARRDSALANDIIDKMRLSNLKCLEIDFDLAELAGKVKAKHSGISLADCFIAAMYLKEKADVLVSSDPHFRKIKGVNAQTPDEFSHTLAF